MYIRVELLGTVSLRITCIISKLNTPTYGVLSTEYYHRIATTFLDVAIVAVGVHWAGYIFDAPILPLNPGLFTAEAMRREVTSGDRVYSSSR